MINIILRFKGYGKGYYCYYKTYQKKNVLFEIFLICAAAAAAAVAAFTSYN